MTRLAPVCILILLAASLGAVASARPRRLGALGMLVSVLGCVSVRVAGGSATLAVSTLSALPVSTLAIDAGFVLLGLTTIVVAAGPALKGGGAGRFAALAVLLAVGFASWSAWPLLAAAAPADALAVALVGAAASVFGFRVLGMMKSGAVFRWLDRRILSPTEISGPPAASLGTAAVVAAGTIAAAAGPHLALVIFGALAAVAAVRPGTRLRFPLRLMIAACGLLPLLWLTHTIAGPVGLGMRHLADVPVSSAAEAMLIPLLALGAFPCFVIWPLHGRVNFPLLPVGVALVSRIGAALAGGMEPWQSLLVPLGVLGATHAVAARRPSELAGALAWMACVVSPEAGGAVAGAWLAVFVLFRWSERFVSGGPAQVVRCATWIVAALGGAMALETILRAQVVYGLLAAACMAGSIWLDDRQPAVGSST